VRDAVDELGERVDAAARSGVDGADAEEEPTATPETGEQEAVEALFREGVAKRQNRAPTRGMSEAPTGAALLQ